MSQRAGSLARAATLVVALTSLVLLSPVLVSPVLVSPGVSPAAADTCDGVWVVVDARAAGGSLTTSCAPGDPETGLAALERAGHGYGFVPRIPGMVCTVDARPDPCNGAPADAYWSYWYAEAGGSWTYATTGAGTRDPAPGSVEGWRFGDGASPPGTAPPATAPTAEPEPAPAPETTPEPAPGPDPEPDPAPAPDPGPEPDAPAAQDRIEDRAGGEDSDLDSDLNSDSDSDPGAEPAPAGGSGRAGEEPDADADGRRDADEPSEGGTAGADERGSAEVAEDPAATETDPTTDEGRAGAGEPVPEEVEEELLLATQDGASGPATPLGALVAVGLLAGIGALTWRQRRQRAGGSR